MDVHMPTLRDADRGVPGGGALVRYVTRHKSLHG